MPYEPDIRLNKGVVAGMLLILMVMLGALAFRILRYA